MSPSVLVIGAINVDLVATTDRRPTGGETVLARDFRTWPGGKGGNQAVAAARAGAAASLVAAVGDDQAGVEQVRQLRSHGVRTRWIVAVPGTRTGTAMIVVTPDGENSIVVVPGANASMDLEQVHAALDSPDTPAVLLLQSELDTSLVDAAAARAADTTRVVLNNGPWTALAPATLRLADPLVVNEHEARDACVRTAACPVEDLAHSLRACTAARSVLVALGARGVLLSDATADTWLPAEAAAPVVDTTGAGDMLAGTVAGHLALGDDLRTAVEAALRAAAAAVTWSGARPPLQDATRGEG